MVDIENLDLLALIGTDTTLRRVASTGGGEWAGPCPFCGGRDRFRVQPERPGGGRWWCRQCSPDERWHSAADYVMQRYGMDFWEACAYLEGKPLGGDREPARGNQEETKRKPEETKKGDVDQDVTPPSSTWQRRALKVVSECEAALWSAEGEKARSWLTKRGLRENTIRTWRLGYNSTDRKIRGLWIPGGIVIPCFVGGVLWYVKVRRLDSEPKYMHVEGGKSALYGIDALDGKRVVVICEGELDTVLLWQEAGDLVDVVGVGSAQTRPDPSFLIHLLGSTYWLAAHDHDGPGEKGAKSWGEFSKRVRRIRPLAGKDLTDFHQAGGDLRSWIIYHLERLGMNVPYDPYTWAERIAIMQADGGLSRQEAERIALR
jgi:DNA primase